MIAAGLLLAAIGLADGVRPLVPRAHRWIVLASVAFVVLVIGSFADAVIGGIIAVAGAAAWVWLMPMRSRGRAGFWPTIGLAVVCAISLSIASRDEAGWMGRWHIDSPIGLVSFDQCVLVIGVVLFLMESANSVVRVALAEEHVGESESVADGVGPVGATDHDEPAVAEGAAPLSGDETAHPVAMLKGGRLIGPIERIIVFSLTLATAYPLLAAFIAAKGIVRFPEISRDSGNGNSAEYFLIGSLVSWVLGLAGAFAVWWAVTR